MNRLLVILIFWATSLTCFAKAKLTAYIPKENPTGVGIIVCPGGSYFWLAKKTEGSEVAQWLCDQGYSAFVLEYSHAGWGAFAFHVRGPHRKFPACYEDLKAALDTIRAHATEYRIRPERMGCMGFSAGGHLVMYAAEKLAGSSESLYFTAPIYPVVSMTHPCTHKRSRRGLLGESPSKILMDSLSLENHVPVNCPPVFLMNCDDDPVVNCRNAQLLDSALTTKRIPHLYLRYKTGGHGFGISPDKTTQEAIQWKDRFLEWLHHLVSFRK
jgi:acetyl esterase/lipase